MIGLDEQGREVLTFIHGSTDSSGDPDWVWSERALVEAGRLIRRYHDLCRSFRPPVDAEWQLMVGAPAEGEVICHNDLAPFNTVYDGGVPVAFLDWDLAAPGPPVWDVAYAAWRFVPFYGDSAGRGWPTDVTHRATRLRLLCDAYELTPDERARLPELIERRIRCALDTLESWGRAGKPGWARMWQERTHRDGMLGDLAYVQQHRGVLNLAVA
ncbi:phosphotransferase [Actinopolymorpha cephalotaxi]|uniref:Aminoglycoside phosphotransferase (APT) family kinase protein n=1 Tax=Actinopolymorpha cephalotaxi TaxID=504797 RepID=A0ABX2SDG6_9ACTN|nr:phosphotransferase [Actinopolymorpha cephalotaxi]NYH86322.1 aminoglycoside phosphotransferase (APT) family kinase protein [Actinopolymorpha cephalotaxi]